jgi:hypothetical protein
MWGRAGRRSPIARDGDLVIDGRVRARLLGLPLLDIDAHVVVTPAHAARRLRPDDGWDGSRRRGTGTADHLQPRRGRPRIGRDARMPPGLARAEHLIAEGTDLIAEARRIH